MKDAYNLFVAAAAKFLLRSRGMEEVPKEKRKVIMPPKGGTLVDAMPNGKIRRNGPCPCGSNEKFKKCHLPRVRSGEFEKIKAFT